jgi:hypothetical protein
LREREGPKILKITQLKTSMFLTMWTAVNGDELRFRLPVPAPGWPGIAHSCRGIVVRFLVLKNGWRRSVAAVPDIFCSQSSWCLSHYV